MFGSSYFRTCDFIRRHVRLHFFIAALLVSGSIILWESSCIRDGWSPLGDDYALLARVESATPGALVTTSWHGLFDAGAAGEGMRSDLYRPVLDLSIWMDTKIAAIIPGFRMIYTSLLILLLLSIAAAAFFRTFLDDIAALASTAIFTLHASRSDAVFSLANRSDPLVALLLLTAALLLIAFARQGGGNRRVLSWLCFVLALLTKETALVGIILPVVVALMAARRQRSYTLRMAVIDTGVFTGIAAGYFVLRLLLFHGLGHYGNGPLDPAAIVRNAFLVFYYLLFGNEYDLRTSLMQVPLVLPLLLLLGYLALRRVIRPEPALLVALLALLLAAPALPCSSGKRFVILPLLVAISYCATIATTLGSRLHRRLFAVAVLLVGCAQLLQWSVIRSEFHAAFVEKTRYDAQLAHARPVADTVYVILPNNCGANAWLFSNRIDCYLRRFAPFRSKTIVPVAYVSNKKNGGPCPMRIERADDGTALLHLSGRDWFFRPILPSDGSGGRFRAAALQMPMQRHDPRPDELVIGPGTDACDLMYPDGEKLRIVSWSRLPVTRNVIVAGIGTERR
jgi:hypothetical protein